MQFWISSAFLQDLNFDVLKHFYTNLNYKGIQLYLHRSILLSRFVAEAWGQLQVFVFQHKINSVTTKYCSWIPNCDIHTSPLSNILTLSEKYGTGNHTNHCWLYLQGTEAVSLSHDATLSCFIHTRVENTRRSETLAEERSSVPHTFLMSCDLKNGWISFCSAF
jgi:hypothetical protein